jgi:hypothetical protein
MSQIVETKRPPVKDFWFTHRLAPLGTNEFLKVVNKVLKGEYVLLRTPEDKMEFSVTEEGK